MNLDQWRDVEQELNDAPKVGPGALRRPRPRSSGRNGEAFWSAVAERSGETAFARTKRFRM
jgi:hypothetical protein